MRRHLGALLVLLTTLSACTPGHGVAHPPAPHAPGLVPAWTAKTGSRPDRAWVVGRTLATADDQGRFAGIDTRSGQESWHLALDSAPCAWSAPNRAGLLAVLTRTKDKEAACLTAVVVDLAHGKVLWSRTVVHPAHEAWAEFDGVSVGDSVVAVTDSGVYGAVRLGARTGRVLSTTPNGRYATDRPAVSDGRHVFSVGIPATSARHVRVVVTDQESGRTVGSFAASDTYKLHAFPGDPEVLGADGRQGGTYLWSGTRGRLVGRGVPDGLAVAGQRLVATYPGLLVVDDLGSGKELAAVPLGSGDELVGVSGGDAIVRSELGVGSDAVGTIERFALTDPGSPQVLGVLQDRPLTVSGDTVYAVADESVSAYRLPADGPALSTFEDGLAWRAGDLRPADVLDACLAVSPSVRRRIGSGPISPVQGSCSWWRGGHLTVTTTAVEPTDETSAVDATTKQVTQPPYGATEVRLGQGAWIDVVPHSPGGAYVRLAVRWRNVIVEVDDGGRRNVQTYRTVAIAAARQVLTELQRRAG